jgi:hypothetical protein
MKRPERHRRIVELLGTLRSGQAVTVRWIARQLRLAGQRHLINKDVRALESEGHLKIETIFDTSVDVGTGFARSKTQKLLIIRMAND